MILTTTGNSTTVTIVGLRAQDNNDLVLTHPQTVNLLDNYDNEDIQGVIASIQAEIDNLNITVTRQDGVVINDVTNEPNTVYDLADVALTGEYSDLNNLPTIPPAAPVDSVNGQTGVVVLDKNDIGLDQVDNTSDINKPISIDTQAALDDKVDDSQVLTDVPAGAVFTDTIYDDTAVQNDITDLQNEQTTQDTAIALNTAKVSADGPVSTHSDVNLAGGISGDILTIENGVVIPKTIDNNYYTDTIHFEENGGISNGQYEWSVGNGSTGPRLGYIVPEDCELYKVSINVDSNTVGTSASVNIRRAAENTAEVNNSPIIATPVFTGNNQTIDIPVQQLNSGDVLILQTNTVNGAWSDVRVYLHVRRIAQVNIAKTTYSQVGGSAINFTSTAFADVPGLTTTVTLTRPGDVWGECTYSAQRAGGTNATTQFRVVIENDNGTAFPDTLSTFFDNGVADHFRENLPVGTYTIKVQAATTQPINIGAIALKATAAED